MGESQSFWAHLRRHDAIVVEQLPRIVGGSNGSAMEKDGKLGLEVLQRSMPIFHLKVY